MVDGVDSGGTRGDGGALFFHEGAAEFIEGDVLELADALAGDTEFFADFFEGFGGGAVEAEAGDQDAAFAFVEDIEEVAELVAEVFVAKHFVRVLGFCVADDFVELGGAVFINSGVEGGGAECGGFEGGDFGDGEAEFFGELIVCGFAAELFGHLEGDAADFGDFVHEVDGEADGFALVGEGALDGLFDPPGGVGAEFAAFAGVEALDGFDEADVAFGDEVEEGHAEVGVIAGDFDDEAEVGADHDLLGLGVALADTIGEGDFLLDGEEGKFGDVAEVLLETVVGVFVGHGCVAGFAFEGFGGGGGHGQGVGAEVRPF